MDSMMSSIMFSMFLNIGLVLIVTVVILVFVFRAISRSQSAGTAAAQMKMPVNGTLLVTAASMPSKSAIYQNCRLTGVITAEGVDAVAVQLHGLIRTNKWPHPGQTLPVIVDRADPNRFAIEWDKIVDGSTEALNQAEQLAAAMRQGHDPLRDQPSSGNDYTN